MPGSVGNLFGKYSATYSKAGEGAGRVPLGPKELRKASLNELRGFDGDVLRVSKRGSNFLDRIVCWLEDRVFSLTSSGSRESSRQSYSREFSNDVKAALLEIGVSDDEGDIKDHNLIKQIESVRKRDLPLRSGFVQSILREVALQARDNGQNSLPDVVGQAFAEKIVSSANESGRQTQVGGEVTGRNYPNPSIPEMTTEINIAGGEDFMNQTGVGFTEELCLYTQHLFAPSLNKMSKERGCTLEKHQRDQVVRDATLQLAKRKFPGGEGEDDISGTMVNAKKLFEGKFNVNATRGSPKSVEHLKDVVFDESSRAIFAGRFEEYLLEDYISESLDRLGVGLGESQNHRPSIKDRVIKDFERQSYNKIVRPMRSVARDIIGGDRFNVNNKSPISELFLDHTHQDRQNPDIQKRHKENATQIFSNHYDAAVLKGNISLDEVETVAIEEFMQQFRQEFKETVEKL